VRDECEVPTDFKGAGFKSLPDICADTTTPHGRLMPTVLAGLAEFAVAAPARAGSPTARGVVIGPQTEIPTSARRPLRDGNQASHCGHRPSYNVSTAPSAGCSRARSVNVASFVLCGCPAVAKTIIPTSGVARIADVAIRFWDPMALSRHQKKLFPHFGEAGTAVFAVKEVEYGGHDRTPSFDHDHAIISLVVQDVI
jgi:hypothetical protein